MILYLSRLRLVTWQAAVAADLADCCRMHQRLLTAFDRLTDGRPMREAYGLLFRQESPGVLLVQSHQRPDWSRLPTAYTREVMVKAIDPKLEVGMGVRFCLVGNATRAMKRDDGRHSSHVPIVAADERHDWLRNQAALAGLQVWDVQMTLQRPLSGQRRAEQRVVLTVARYEGIAQVNDPVALRQAVAMGIGRGKAYGCGLLSLAPAVL